MKASMTIVSFILAFATANPVQRSKLVDRATPEELPLCNGKSAFSIPGENCRDLPVPAPKAAAKPEELPLCNGKSAFSIPGENCRDLPAPAAAKPEELRLCNGKSALDIPGENCREWPALAPEGKPGSTPGQPGQGQSATGSTQQCRDDLNKSAVIQKNLCKQLTQQKPTELTAPLQRTLPNCSISSLTEVCKDIPQN